MSSRPATVVRPTFRDPGLQEAIEEDGYVVLDLALTGGQVRALQDHYEAFDRPTFFSWPGGSDISLETRGAISRGIMQVLRPHLERYLLDYRLLKAIFLPKQSEEKSASLGQQDRTSVIAAHTDPTIVDEDRYRSLVFWTALCDVDENNGCLWVVRGSHRDTPRLRCFPFTNLMKYANDILESTPNAQQSLPMKAGTIMMFHPGLLHGSGPNFSGNARIAIQGTAMPVEAEHLHLRLRDDGRIARFRVADDHGLTYAMPEFDELGELIDVRDPV